ncbi:MAG: hypothetical protein JWN17_724 [Frankiales bacterium]|nr:hypothetical protein [Frankiales bacterium]
MSFRVQPAVLRSTAHRLEGLGRQADEAGEYAEAVVVEGEGAGMFLNIVGTSRRTSEAVTASLRHLARLAEESGRQLVRTAEHYEHTDRARAAHLDALASKLQRLAGGKQMPS